MFALVEGARSHPAVYVESAKSAPHSATRTSIRLSPRAGSRGAAIRPAGGARAPWTETVVAEDSIMASATLHSKQKEIQRQAKAQAKRLRKQERREAKRKDKQAEPRQ